ncbi:hypothetical protein C4573_00890 [Candidatus Woesearchaeota archaeon]|nr:MAG: hypothetical protein C4573_00890 [Candidatus Woesearchaeota archaeon]
MALGYGQQSIQNKTPLIMFESFQNKGFFQKEKKSKTEKIVRLANLQNRTEDFLNVLNKIEENDIGEKFNLLALYLQTLSDRIRTLETGKPVDSYLKRVSEREKINVGFS